MTHNTAKFQALTACSWLQKNYKAAKSRFDEDPEFKERSRKAVTKLQGGDADFIKAWERICEASRKVRHD